MIRRLDDATIRQIAAGEVIERPASVLRELLDNALDAGAQDVTIVLEKGGKEFLSVEDNGCGMAPEELEMAPVLHATSKIQNIDDLQQLHTFGFRGEALAAIAEVSSFYASSRTAQSEYGWELHLDWGKPQPLVPKGMNAGTLMAVKGLFSRLPARLKFMGSDAGEYRACVGELIKKALAHPQCAFRLIHNGVEAYNLPPAWELHERIRALFPDALLKGLAYEEGGMKIVGFCSPPSWYRPTRSHQFFFVNGRPVEWTGLRGQIAAAYGNYLPPGRFPACFLYMHISPEIVDFNVHPQKKEIRFQKEGEAAALVRRALRSALSLEPLPEVAQHFPEREITSAPRADFRQAPSLEEKKTPKRQPFTPPLEAEPVSLFVSKEGSLRTARYAGQIFHTYLIFEESGRVSFLDFHALHERVRYEALKEQKSLGLEPRLLLIPHTFSVPKREAEELALLTDAFQPLGFSLSPIGEAEFSSDTLPAFLDSAKAEEVLLDLFYLMKGQPDFSDAQLWDQACKSIACKGSVKSGDRLSESEVWALIQQWEDLGSPPSCPHGRPIRIAWQREFFDKEFKRLGF